jgi:2'-5' RNA ligase/GNAT superfamily N-acetyltransferase
MKLSATQLFSPTDTPLTAADRAALVAALAIQNKARIASTAGMWRLSAADMPLSEADTQALKGGVGSGNFAHAGRPGEVGGSAPSGSGEQLGRRYRLDKKIVSKDVFEQFSMGLSGRQLPEINAMLGVPSDTNFVQYDTNSEAGSITATIFHDDYDAQNVLQWGGREEQLHMELLHVKPEKQGHGLGTEIFQQQMLAADRSGIKTITLFAARAENDPADPMVGYRVWPKLGFDAVLRSAAPEITELLDESEFKDAKTIQELYATKEGREWWAENGVGINMKFNTSAGSRSRQIFDAYMNRKRSKATAPVPMATKYVYVYPDLYEDGEAGLDKVWAELDLAAKQLVTSAGTSEIVYGMTAGAMALDDPLAERAQDEGPGTPHPVTGRKYSSTQVDLPFDMATRLKEISVEQIPDSDLDKTEGREENPHITVKYGIHDEFPEAVEEALIGYGPAAATIGKIGIFEAAEYDVVYLGVESADLTLLNKVISENVNVTDTQKSYIPHITLGYVKKGRATKYAGRDTDLTGQTVVFDKIMFHSRNGEEYVIPLSEVVAGAGDAVDPEFEPEPAPDKKGGVGSGNFGHAGRPGLVGGSVAGGGEGKVLAQQVREQGGFTYSTVTNKSPKSGYVVAIPREHGYERIYAKSTFKGAKAKELLKDFLREVSNGIKSGKFKKNAHAGAWFDAKTDRVVLDVSEVFKNERRAIKIGKERNQDAIYRLGVGTVYLEAQKSRDSSEVDGGGNGSGVGSAGGEYSGDAGTKVKVEHDGMLLWRKPTAVELQIDLKAIQDEFDAGEARLREQLDRLRRKLLTDAAAGIIKLEPADYHTLTVNPAARDITALAAELQRIYEHGRNLVLEELRDQGAGEYDEADVDTVDELYQLEYEDELAQLSEVTASRMANDVQSRVAAIAAGLIALGIAAGTAEFISRLTADVADLSTSFVDANAAMADHVALNTGRESAAATNSNIIREVYYSSVLDQNTCEFCQADDGETGPTSADITQVPNPDCLGRGRCRCIHVYVYESEAPKGTTKFNPYHDERGRFTTGPSAGAGHMLADGSLFYVDAGETIGDASQPPPKVVFHGTSKEAAEKIKKEGLIAGVGEGGDVWLLNNRPFIYQMGGFADRPAAIYITEERYHALRYAGLASEVTDSEPVLLKIRIPASETAKIQTDEQDPHAIKYCCKIPPEWIESITVVDEFPMTVQQVLEQMPKAAKAADRIVYAVILTEKAGKKFNPNHEPAGSSIGGQFTSGVEFSTDQLNHALSRYGSSEYEEIQAKAKASGKQSKHEIVSMLDAAIENSEPLPADTVLYRGIEAVGDTAEEQRLLENLVKGYSFAYDGFSSVTKDKEVAERFALGGGAVEGTSVLVELKLGQPTKAAFVKDSGLQEYILQRAAKGGYFHIDSVKQYTTRFGTKSKYVKATYVIPR